MDFKKRLESFEFKNEKFEPKIIQENPITAEEIEKKLSRELKKGNLMIQGKIDKLSESLLEKETEVNDLKKSEFRLKREVENLNREILNTRVFLSEILNSYSFINSFTSLNNEEAHKLSLLDKKIAKLIENIDFNKTARVSENYNLKYHEAINKITEEKEYYVIEEILEQGYVVNGEIINIAKVKIK